MPEKNIQTAVFGGGCFWCTEAILQRLKGVISVSPGYAGGHIKNPTYEQVCGGTTGHAEVTKFEFDPTQITFRDLLEIFFTTHDPTTLNRQGNDIGEQYRSAIFYTNNEQKAEAEKFIQALKDDRTFNNPIVTTVEPLNGNFYEAEDYHKNYYNRNQGKSYCQVVINPKLEKFKKTFAEKIKAE